MSEVWELVEHRHCGRRFYARTKETDARLKLFNRKCLLAGEIELLEKTGCKFEIYPYESCEYKGDK